MQGADYLIVLLLGLSTIVGFVRGFVRESIMFIAWVVGIWAAWHFAYLLNPWLGGLLATPGVQQWAGRAIVLIGVLLLGTALSSLAAYLTHKAVGLEIGDRLLDAAFGFARAVVVIGLLVIAGRALQLEQENWWERARLMPFAATAANWLERYAEPAVDRLMQEADRAAEEARAGVDKARDAAGQARPAGDKTGR